MNPSRRLIDRIISILVACLDLPENEPPPEALFNSSSEELNYLPAVIFNQGIGPYLHFRYRDKPFYSALRPELQTFLAREYEWNSRRIERMQAELKELLAESGRIGIAVMPLKGSLITSLGTYEPGIRPMADLDLLIRPSDRENFAEILRKRGYQLQNSENNYSKHDRYIRPSERVVSWEGEHPDNPRPIEVHTEIRRRLWGDVGSFDISSWLWSGSENGLVLGEQAWIPKIDSLLLHVALHATENLLIGKGRLIQWLDLAYLAVRAQNIETLPFVDHLLPSLILAKRAIPIRMSAVNLNRLASQVHPRLVTWAYRTPLNSQCGLIYELLPKHHMRLIQHWARWRPDPWRMAVGYGNVSLMKAYRLHFLAIIRSLQRVYRIKATRTLPSGLPIPEG